MIEERAKPIVAATEKSAEKITSALKKSEDGSPYEFYWSMPKKKDKYFSSFMDQQFQRQHQDVLKKDSNNVHIEELANIKTLNSFFT